MSNGFCTDASASLVNFIQFVAHACFLTDQDGKVITMNNAAESLFGGNAAFLTSRLKREFPDYRQVLENLRQEDTPSTPGTVIHYLNPDAGLSIILRIVPLTSYDCHTTKIIRFMFLAFDLQRLNNPTPIEALRLLGLTSMETVVATLIGSGFSPQEAANRLKSSVLTVRAHLKSIYSKLDFKRQQDLAVVITRLQTLL